MKKWKCTVCGYIHTGAEPPDKCPVCGADKSKFVEISLEEAAKLEPTSPKPKETKAEEPSGLTGFIVGQITKHHVHPVSTHFPNGVLPFTVAFLFLAVFFQIEGMAFAAFLNLIGVMLTMPVVLFSGIIDWKFSYGGKFTGIFVTKMICGALVLIIGAILVGWRILNPDVAGASTGMSWAFLFLHLIMLGAAGVAGFIGGEIVFGTYGKQSD